MVTEDIRKHKNGYDRLCVAFCTGPGTQIRDNALSKAREVFII